MAKDIVEIQRASTQFQDPLKVEEFLFIKNAKDWRQPYSDFLLYRLLSSNRSDAKKIKEDLYDYLLNKDNYFEEFLIRHL